MPFDLLLPSENSWVVITADCGKPPGSNVAVDVKPYCQFWHMGTVGASTPGIDCFATVATAGREINADTCLNSGTVEEAYIFLMPSLCLGEIWATQTPASPALRAEEVSQLLLCPVLDLLWVLRSLRRWDNFCQGLLCSTACGMLVGYAHTWCKNVHVFVPTSAFPAQQVGICAGKPEWSYQVPLASEDIARGFEKRVASSSSGIFNVILCNTSLV